MWRTEKFRIFYKGMFCTLLGASVLSSSLVVGHGMKERGWDPKIYGPLVFFAGCGMAHPYMVVAAR